LNEATDEAVAEMGGLGELARKEPATSGVPG